MSFEKRNFKTTYTKNTRHGKRKNIFSYLPTGQVMKYTLILSTIVFLLLVWIIYQKYIRPLPSIKELENIDIAESSIIFDKDGNELYKVYKEKRTYVPYDKISQNMVHAIVAWEDKTFFQNGGVDFTRMIGAIVYFWIGKADRIKWTSTISQQLIRNTIIKNENSIERKIKEMYLSYKLNKGVSKEKILELYLNKIFYGSNAYGIEQAAKTFFWKKASDISPLEASILASLPKWPAYYSPYNYPDRLLGYPYIFDKETPDDTKKIITPKDVVDNNESLKKFTDEIQNYDARKVWETDSIVICWLTKGYYKNGVLIDSNGCTTEKYEKLMNLLNSIQIPLDESQVLEYQAGRKDFILQRMLEDGYIDFNEYKKGIINGIAYKFNTYTERIKYPHFVFYVKEYVEAKYGKDILEKGWLKVYTTIDSKLQDKAEALIKSYGDANEKRINADNAAIISIDNKTWGIVAFVWWRDYFKEWKWNVNIITSKLQPGSSFKPFVYALAIDTKQIGSKSPIYDVKTFFTGYGYPKNFDGKFMGKMNITTALDHSRNIPAIKMYYLAWREEKIVPFMQKLWMENLKEDGKYGAPMALWTPEVTPLDMAKSYSVFANLGYKKEITPILKIVDSKWLVIEETKEQIWEKVLSEATAYITNAILSDTTWRPDGWNKYLTLRDRSVAAKTGTSTKQYTKKNGEKVILPRNLWTIWYTPQYTTVVWVGNTDGKEVSMNGDGLMSAWPIWRDFMNYAHTGKKVETWKMPSSVKVVNISPITGKIASSESGPTIKSLFKNAPWEYDAGLKLVKVDALCNWKISDKTPESAIKEVYLLDFTNIGTELQAWEWSIRDWMANLDPNDKILSEWNYITSMKDEYCERDNLVTNIELSSSIKDGTILSNWENYIEVYYNSVNPVIWIDFYLWENKISSVKIENQKEWVYKWGVIIPSWYYDNYTFSVKVIDNAYYSTTQNASVSITQKDTSAPVINLSQPKSPVNSIQKSQTLPVSAYIQDNAQIKSINIYIDETPLKIWVQGRSIDYILNEKWDIPLWKHIVRIEAVDAKFNKSSTSFELNIIE
jgi:penicillin-binding protein 1A